MKTTIDLPDDLVREMKLRAVRENRRIKDVAADLISLGLRADVVSRLSPSQKSSLPVLKAGQKASKAEPDGLSPQEMSDFVNEQLDRNDFDATRP